MLKFPDIDPVAFSIGPVSVHWYGIMYLIAFAMAWWLGRLRAKDPRRGWKPTDIDDLLFYGALGIILGGRLGYILFYGFSEFLAAPLSVFQIWKGGMSFHGGLLGVLVAMWFFAKKQGRGFFEITDFIAPIIPPGLGAGRIGNFINAELWGKETDVPWGMVFPNGGEVARHPSQIYQFLLEGVALFLILWVFSAKPRPTMAVSGLFLIAYGVFRFLVEFVRVPDAHLNYLALGWVTMGQVLSAPMVLIGIFMFWWAYRARGTGGRELTGGKTST